MTRPDVRFLAPVHLYGHALNLERLADLRREFRCRIVEDCAQSIGASFNGVPTGTAGEMAATSFYPTKNLGAMGDGGAILTSNQEFAAMTRVMRDYGQSAKYRHDVVGYNSRLDELQAGLMRRVGLGRLNCWTAARRRIASAYLSGIRNPALRLIGAPAGSDSCWHLFPIQVDPLRKADFMGWLKLRGIVSAEHYPVPIPDQPALSGVATEILGGIETARSLCRSVVSLPIHPYLTSQEIDQIIEACNRWNG